MAVNRDFDREIRFEIVEEIGVITVHSTGWRKELNLVCWNGGLPKYDIRDWSPDHERMSRGVTLHENEMRHIFDLMKKRRTRRRNRRTDSGNSPLSADASSFWDADEAITSNGTDALKEASRQSAFSEAGTASELSEADGQNEFSEASTANEFNGRSASNEINGFSEVGAFNDFSEADRSSEACETNEAAEGSMVCDPSMPSSTCDPPLASLASDFDGTELDEDGQVAGLY